MTTADEINHLRQFKSKMLDFIEELIQQFPTEPSFVIVRIFVADKIPVKDVLGRFMKECLPFTKAVQERNDKFFVYSDFIFEKYVNDVGEENLQNFRMLWESDRLDKDDKQVIWDWMDLFMSIARRYYNKFGCVEDWEFDLEIESEKINKIIS